MVMDSDGKSLKSDKTCGGKFKINGNLVMLKITLFVMYGATASLIPFLTIHMQSIGLNVEDIAIVYLALPLTTFLAPPVTGFLVDKFGHYKPVLFISLALNAIFHHSLLLIPQMETPGQMPAAYVMRHPESGKVEIWWSPCPNRDCPEAEELNMVLDDCVDHCLLDNGTHKSTGKANWLVPVEQSIAVRPPTFIGVPPTALGAGVGCPLTGPGVPTINPDQVIPGAPDSPDLHFLFGKQHLKNTTKSSQGGKKKPKGSSNSTTTLQNQTQAASNKSAGVAESLQQIPPGDPKNTTTPPEPEESVFVLLDMHSKLGKATENLGLEIPSEEEDEDTTDFRQHFSEELLRANRVNVTALTNEDIRCGGMVLATNLTINRLTELAADCMLQKCIFTVGGPDVCPPDYQESDDRVFWLYFLLRFLGTTMLSASVTVMDPIALTLIQEYGGEFGRERLFSTVGQAIFSPLTGLLIDYRSRQVGHTDYSSAFYLYDILLAISMLTVLMMPLGAKVPADNIMKDLMRLLRLPHVITFIFFLFVLGNCWGFIESYLFLYLKELGAPNYLLGITVSVGTMSSIPFLYGAEKITKQIGHVNIIIVAFFSHAVRLIGYSFIENPWWVFPFETIESLAVHLMWVAAATYCTLLAPRNLIASFIGILGMAHFSLGRGSGSFLGGHLMGDYGTRQSFQIMGVVSAISGVLYGFLHFIWLRKFDGKTFDKGGDSAAITEQAEMEKLKAEELTESQEVAAELAERLSLMIKFNHRGSLTSLDREHIMSRRNSAAIERGSKVDLLKTTLETNLVKKTSPQLTMKTSNPTLNVIKPEQSLTPQFNRRNSTQNSIPLQEERPRSCSGSIPEEDHEHNTVS
ncbi:hypothetical protein M8J76_001727 [Diaphorina citri]|nr:hypothetical protein M8J76_001727 [Diaphorina citri]